MALNLQSISAVTLAVRDMAAAVEFYEKCGFHTAYGGKDADFTSFAVGAGHLNLILSRDHRAAWWGRVIFHMADVDAHHRQLVAAGLSPEAEPADAPWGERYFHIRDPDGHELSFAQLLR